MSSYYDDPDFAEEYRRRDEEAESAYAEESVKCSACGQVGGPYPNGDRPKSTRLQSGCPRCGWCY